MAAGGRVDQQSLWGGTYAATGVCSVRTIEPSNIERIVALQPARSDVKGSADGVGRSMAELTVRKSRGSYVAQTSFEGRPRSLCLGSVLARQLEWFLESSKALCSNGVEASIS